MVSQQAKAPLCHAWKRTSTNCGGTSTASRPRGSLPGTMLSGSVCRKRTEGRCTPLAAPGDGLLCVPAAYPFRLQIASRRGT